MNSHTLRLGLIHEIFTDVKVSSGLAGPGSLGPGSLSEDEAAELADGFKLLGEPNRVRLLFALLDAGELCVGDLAAAVDVSETTVSHGMRLLRAAGIVRNRRSGRRIYYRLDDIHVAELLDLSRAHLGHRRVAP